MSTMDKAMSRLAAMSEEEFVAEMKAKSSAEQIESTIKEYGSIAAAQQVTKDYMKDRGADFGVYKAEEQMKEMWAKLDKQKLAAQSPNRIPEGITPTPAPAQDQAGPPVIGSGNISSSTTHSSTHVGGHSIRNTKYDAIANG